MIRVSEGKGNISGTRHAPIRVLLNLMCGKREGLFADVPAQLI